MRVGAAITLPLPAWNGRAWAMPLLTAFLIGADRLYGGFEGPTVTALASAVIFLAGLPHGALDVEIAATRFARQDVKARVIITAIYVTVAALMWGFWAAQPAIALSLFLILSIVHFGADWNSDADPFFSGMVGWALVGLPALSHPKAVASLFETLAGDGNGATIAAILAASAVPAIIGSVIFARLTIKQADLSAGLAVLSCLAAALFLPPLVGFAVFFCGLHSPMHFGEAIHRSGASTTLKKMIVVLAVVALACGFAAWFFANIRLLSPDAALVRTAFVVLSILTVPHFALELFCNRFARQAPV